MYKKIKILLLLSFLLTSCSRMPVNMPIFGDKEFIPIVSQEITVPEKEESVTEELPATEENTTEEVTEEIKKEEIAEDFNLETSEKEEEEENSTESEFEVGEILRNSNMSFYAVDMKTGENVIDYRGDKVVTPASVMKVVTAATALEVLRKDTTLKTEVVADGKIDSKGVLNGNIYIKGGGDPTLGSENFKGNREAFLNEWIAGVKKAGIKSVTGSIIVLDDLFGYEGVSGKWLLEDLATGYGQGVYGISIFDNICTIYLSSDAKGAKVSKTVPDVKGLSFINNLKISPRGRNDITVRGLPFENKRFLIGEVPVNRKTITVRSDIPDPGMFLGEYFKEKLKQSGVVVKGSVKTARTSSLRPKNPKNIAVTESKTVGEMINVLLVKSDNHYAEHLYELIKLKGVNINKFWKEKGIDTSALGMYDGSGLSRADYISAKTLTDILLYMGENYPEYEKMLPKAGVEGTVAGFLGKKKFDGEVRVKSGSMGGVQSYSGYMEKGGKKIAFAIMINQWHGSRRQVKKEIEDLLIKLF